MGNEELKAGQLLKGQNNWVFYKIAGHTVVPRFQQLTKIAESKLYRENCIKARCLYFQTMIPASTTETTTKYGTETILRGICTASGKTERTASKSYMTLTP